MSDASHQLTLSSGGKGRILENKKLRLRFNDDAGIVVFAVRDMCARAGFSGSDEFMIGAAASELATNILRYAGEGLFEVSIIRSFEDGTIGVEILACDEGPGIADLESAMKEHFSTQPGSLGLGLPSVKRIMNEFWIESVPGEGTRILVRKWRKQRYD